MTPEPKIGLFLCPADHLLSSPVDIERLKKLGASYDQVAVVQEVDKIGSPTDLRSLKKTIAEHNLTGLVLATGHLTPTQKPLAVLLAEAGLELDALELVNWRELLPWDDHDPEAAHQKAEHLVRQAIAKLVHQDGLQLQEVDVSGTVLVIGHGWTALRAASELASRGRPVVLVCTEAELGDKREAAGYNDETAADLDRLLEEVTHNPCIEKRLASRVVEFDGGAGQYRVLVEDDQGMHYESAVGGLVLALEPELRASFQAWGLAPSEQIITLADAEALLRTHEYRNRMPATSTDDPPLVVFLLGFTHTSWPVSQRRAFQAAMKLAEDEAARVMVLLDHFKVADEGLEALSQQVRKMGVVFAKVTGDQPTIEPTNAGLEVRFYDEVMNQDMVVQANLIILEEDIRPHRDVAELERILEIQTDRRGFFQGDNVYHLPIYTNRTGVLVIGPGRGPTTLAEGGQEAREAALYLHELLSAGHTRVALNREKLDSKKCAICLTCYRLCPHRAISVVHRRPVFSDLACQVCGICAAECPMQAIQIHNFTDSQFRAELKTVAPGLSTASEDYIPSIIAFSCRNSALEAARLASYRKLKVPRGLELIEVPCAGKVDLDYVMTAFQEGADGVMVLACHAESCKSLQGSTRARQRVELLQEYLDEAGLDPARLVYHGLAPGMSQEFARQARELETTLLELGENPLRQSIRSRNIA